MNPIFQALMNQLKSRNTYGYNWVNSLIQNKGNPNSIVKQALAKLPPEQKQAILNQAKGYGAPDEFLSELQNMK